MYLIWKVEEGFTEEVAFESFDRAGRRMDIAISDQSGQRPRGLEVQGVLCSLGRGRDLRGLEPGDQVIFLGTWGAEGGHWALE